jgi:hypothetical protein
MEDDLIVNMDRGVGGVGGSWGVKTDRKKSDKILREVAGDYKNDETEPDLLQE